MADLALCSLCRAPLRQGSDEFDELVDRLADASRRQWFVQAAARHAVSVDGPPAQLEWEQLTDAERERWRIPARATLEIAAGAA